MQPLQQVFKLNLKPPEYSTQCFLSQKFTGLLSVNLYTKLNN